MAASPPLTKWIQCPRCGERNNATWSTCTACGSDLQEGRPVAGGSRLSWQRIGFGAVVGILPAIGWWVLGGLEGLAVVIVGVLGLVVGAVLGALDYSKASSRLIGGALLGSFPGQAIVWSFTVPFDETWPLWVTLLGAAAGLLAGYGSIRWSGRESATPV